MLYDTAVRDPGLKDLVYFGSLLLPAGPTAYDYLLLSLREKDFIATFNWDPLLLQAYARHATLRRLPQLLFLHGAVGVGICMTCRVKGPAGMRCGLCHALLAPSRLLYFVADKDYTSDPFIAAEWAALREILRHAYFITIYGYRAPKSDAAAIQCFKPFGRRTRRVRWRRSS